MTKNNSEKRRHQRFETGVEVFFQVAYDLKTKVNFQKVEKDTGQVLNRKYSALSRNVSVEGICFTCGHRLNQGELLQLEILSAQNRKPIIMQGEVRWCEATRDDESKFDTGVKINTVNGEGVERTFHSDDTNQIVWSAVLQTVIGDFKRS